MRFQTVYILIFAALITFPAHAEDYQSAQIVSPEPDATIHDNNGNVTVTAVVSPTLRAGDRLALLLDGKTVAAGSQQSFELNDIDRGTHTLRVQVQAPDGTVLITSPPVEFHMWRASLLFRNRGPMMK